MSERQRPTRAELARQRRNQRARKELELTTKRALKPMQSVTSRVPEIVVAPKLTRQSAPRRRFNIALGLPEIHLHKPQFHMPRIRPSWRLTSLVLVVLLGVVIYLSLTLPYFHVPNITLLGGGRLSREEIEAVLAVNGQSIFTVQPDELEVRLRMNYPELSSVDIHAYLPNHVYVTVVEREPVILWQQGGGFTWIDASGVAFRPRGMVATLVPVNGLSTPPAGQPATEDPLSPMPYVSKELVDSILILAPNVPAGATMFYDAANGLGWEDERGWKAYFGISAHDMPLKIRVYQSLVASLTSRGTVPVFISVVYPDAPFYRMADLELDATDAASEDAIIVEDGQQ
ncbi:MAG TPA: FtsQ-type POTRA domain-containing protein [Anaerolineales bacterium]|nr:FtsQ-type POTRA domain-containing protein [Anaerolineales bacterium]HNC87814.1 FtsQ-type POTRA domain-containing protein [Anaerolineales bacterium]HNJ12233.1 FtsQ-type POTRA domain-containing protein [Anaerolineales bacterium]HUM26186.1 FtsQ-type POTRA domain-containing protein [Anaerolineales bacterium]